MENIGGPKMNGMCLHLCQKYFNLPTFSRQLLKVLSVVNSDNIIEELNRMLKEWDYEILGEAYILNDRYYCLTIALYVPGYAKTGIATVPILTDQAETFREEAVKRAIQNACHMLPYDYEPAELSSPTVPLAKKKFSDEQKEALRNLRTKHDIKTDAQMMELFQLFNPAITNKKQITPDNVDDFLKWSQDFFCATDDFEKIVGGLFGE